MATLSTWRSTRCIQQLFSSSKPVTCHVTPGAGKAFSQTWLISIGELSDALEGFEQLNPRFCLQRIGITTDDEKLPSAATCFNTLKLPNYSSEKVMKKKLLLSISSNAGFELT